MPIKELRATMFSPKCHKSTWLKVLRRRCKEPGARKVVSINTQPIPSYRYNSFSPLFVVPEVKYLTIPLPKAGTLHATITTALTPTRPAEFTCTITHNQHMYNALYGR